MLVTINFTNDPIITEGVEMMIKVKGQNTITFEVDDHEEQEMLEEELREENEDFHVVNI